MRVVARTVGLVMVVSLPSSLTGDLLPLVGEQAGPPAPLPPSGGGWGVGVVGGGCAFCIGWLEGPSFGGLSGIGARCTGERIFRLIACCKRFL